MMISRSILAVSFLGLLCFAVPACDSMEVNVTETPHVNLSKYKTYAWFPMRQSLGNPQASELNLMIRSSIEHQLTEKRLALADADTTADLQISYSAKSETQYKYGGNYGSGWDGPKTDPFQEGTLAVLLIDPKTNKVVWSGRAMFPIIDPKRDPKKDPNLIDQAAKELFKNFPVT